MGSTTQVELQSAARVCRIISLACWVGNEGALDPIATARGFDATEATA